jgi:hypothetical protein
VPLEALREEDFTSCLGVDVPDKLGDLRQALEYGAATARWP